MSNLPVIAGIYADLRQVKSRGVWQVLVEIPSEAAEKLVETFGLPRQDEPTWLAVARLKVPPGASNGAADRSSAEAGTPTPLKPAAPQAETKGGWYGLKPSARAALLCKEPEFQVWFLDHLEVAQDVAQTSDDVAGMLRSACAVFSRAALDPSHPHHAPIGLKRFSDYERAYRVSRGLETELR